MISRRSLFGTVLGAFAAPQVRANEAEPSVRLMSRTSCGLTVIGAGEFNFYSCETYVVRNAAPAGQFRAYYRLSIADEAALKGAYRLYYPPGAVDELLDLAVDCHNRQLVKKLLTRAGFPPRQVMFDKRNSFA